MVKSNWSARRPGRLQAEAPIDRNCSEILVRGATLTLTCVILLPSSVNGSVSSPESQEVA